jgi:hypothetical protein
VGAEVVLHEHNLFGLEKMCIRQIPEHVGEIDSGKIKGGGTRVAAVLDVLPGQ